MATHADLTIHLRRSRSSATDTDDIIRVYRGETFEIRYRDGETKQTYNTAFSRLEILTYFSILMSALAIDMCPFDSIQIMTNGFPSIVYSIPDIEVGTTGWGIVTTTLRWFANGQWSTRSRAPAQEEHVSQTASSSSPGTFRGAPEFFPSTPLFSVPGLVLQRDCEWGGEENQPDASS